MPFADLVLEGGGVKGIGLVGAISVLEERGYEFKRIAGTSAGSIVGALTAAGLGAPELEKVMREVDYPAFEDGTLLDRFSVVGQGLELLIEQGLYRGDYLRTWLGELLRTAGVKTYADLHYQDSERPLPPEKQYRLVVMASDISQGCLRRLPWDYDHYGRDRDSQLVVESVRASMSIPFFYMPVRWDTTDGKKSWLVDGGMLSNFPIDAFDAPQGMQPRWPTIGIKLSAKPDAAQGIVNDIHGTVSMGVAMIKTMIGFYDRMHIDDPAAVERTIFVDTGSIRSTDFDLTAADQEMLFQAGRQAALDFLDGTPARPAWDFAAYCAKYRALE